MPAADKALWADHDRMQELFGLTAYYCQKLYRQGACRAIKLDAAQQGQWLYRVADMDEYLTDHARWATESDAPNDQQEG